MRPDEEGQSDRESDLDTQVARMVGAWSTAAQIEGRLGGGYRNTVWAVRIGCRRYAARLSAREAAALDWEIDLLDQLRAGGMVVPEVPATQDGRRRVDGLTLFGWLEGRQPAAEADWRLLANELSQLHALTQGWPQRPGFRSSQELLEADRGGDVRLDLMPPEVVSRVREAWKTLAGESMSVVHGDPGASNIRIQGGRAGFLDWDEARVDVSLLDLASLPDSVDLPISGDHLVRGRRAALAWEVANGWEVEPTYARRRLQELMKTT